MKRFASILSILFAVLLSATAHAAPGRIVSLKPTITDVVRALGAGDRLVGITRYCDASGLAAPPAIVGDYTQPSIEGIVVLAPDLVLGSEENSSRKSIEALRRMGLAVELFPFSTLSETLSSIRRIGKALGLADEGDALARSMIGQFAALKRKWSAAPRMLRTVVVWGVRPLIVAGPGSYMDELLPMAGATNALTAVNLRYPQINLEMLIAFDPDAIVDLSMGSETRDKGHETRDTRRETRDQPLRGDWRPWTGVPAIRAVREGRVIALDAGEFRAGPRLPAALAKLAEMLHATTVR